jgi:hypothetical protein
LFKADGTGTSVGLHVGTGKTAAFHDGSASAPTISHEGDANTGIFFPAADTVALTTGGTERARVDSSGNLGLGVTPSAWSGVKAIEMTSAGCSVFSFGSTDIRSTGNAYFNGTNWKYGSTNTASMYAQNSGVHYWYTAASGSAGANITWTQAMTLDASGNLGIGSTAPSTDGVSGYANLVIGNSSTSAAGITMRTNNSGATTQGVIWARGTGGANGFVKYDHYYDALTFGTSSAERARIDSSGNLLVGTTSGGGSTTRVSIVNTSGNANNPVMYLKANATSVATTMLGFYDGSDTFQGQIYCDVSNNTTVYSTSSDYRMKNIEGPLTGAKDFIMALQPKQGTWKSSGAKFVGFVAHEFQEVSPTSVMGEKDAVDEDGKPIYQSMQASSPEVMANLVALIQEQQALITSLTARITALEQA